MIGLRTNFGLSLLLAAGTVVASALLAAVVVHRRRVAGRPWFAPAARVLAGGAVVVVLVTTALPRRFAIESDGDLVLSLGSAGLGDWRQFFDDPLSLASIELVANVVLYAPVAFLMVFGWYRLRRAVLPACLALSMGIEAAQFFVLGRVGALDDVVLNVAGAGLGYGAAMVLIHFGSQWHISSNVDGGSALPITRSTGRLLADASSTRHAGTGGT